MGHFKLTCMHVNLETLLVGKSFLIHRGINLRKKYNAGPLRTDVDEGGLIKGFVLCTLYRTRFFTLVMAAKS